MDAIKRMFLQDIANDQELAERFAHDLVHKYHTLLCIKYSTILGTISWDIKGGIDDGIIEIVGLGVNQEHRRQGIAKELVNALIGETQNFFSEQGYELRIVFLYMEKGNKEGASFYENMNFCKTCEIPSFYPNDDAVIWIKYFNN